MSERNPFGAASPNDIFNRLVELGEAWAERNAAAAMLEEACKPTQARLTLDFMRGGVARVMAETEALASEEYRRHVEQMVLARREANIARVRYQSAQVWADHARTANANRRAEMAMGHLAA